MVDDSQRAWSGQAHRTGCADYEELEWLGDGVLKLLAIMRTMAMPSMEEANLRQLQALAEPLQWNITLCKQSKVLGLPSLCLRRPFQVLNKPLPELRRQLLTRKEQADLVEALLGVACESQLPSPTLSPTSAGAAGAADAANAMGEVLSLIHI